MAVRSAGWDDLERVTGLLAAQNRAATGVGGIDAQTVRDAWSQPGFDMRRDHWLSPGGYASLSPHAELTLASHDAAVADELLECAAGRARERGSETLTVRVLPEDETLTALVHRHPFALVRETLVMWRPLGGPIPQPAWPEGIEVRTFTQADARSVHELLDEAYRAWDAGYGPMPHDEWMQMMTRDAEFDPSVWWLAQRDGELAGCALHWSGGWLKDIAVRASERGRGLGRALVLQGLNELARRGVRRVGLKVDAANPTGARELYESVGFVTERREATWFLRL